MRDLNKEQLNEVCSNNNIEYLALFGSRARTDYKDDSDMDLLVRFRHPVGYITLAKVEEQLNNLFGYRVDLVTEKSISKYIKPYIQKDLRVLYGA
jgi:predicted nucleotidyltransferase